MQSTVRVTYFAEILSSWCHWAEPTWAELNLRFADRVAFDWKIALMPPEAYPESREQCDHFYRRSGSVMQSTYMLNSGWFEKELEGDYAAPNLVAEAGRRLGCEDDRLRLALAEAALRDGRKIGRIDEAVAVGAAVLVLDPARLKAAALSDEVRAAVDASTAEFHAYKIDQRPSFLLESNIGDKAILSGIVRLEPFVATIEAMLKDADGYASFHSHFDLL